MKLLITGGAGFIGSALIREIIRSTNYEVVNVDCLTYAGNLKALEPASSSGRYKLEKVDIRDRSEIDRVFREHEPDLVIHLAAESHVDRSIDQPDPFVDTNIIGTFILLEASRAYFKNLKGEQRNVFRFHHVSTDEVFGDLTADGVPFQEDSPYAPSSPYAASKAASDHLVRAWSRTYGLPVVISNSSNNYGPFQYPEKLVPRLITNALAGKELPIYGSGAQVRDWLYVEDHARALLKVALHGKNGDTYNIGGRSEFSNIEVARMICDQLDEAAASCRPKEIKSYRDLIAFVEDRPGHDSRYAINPTKIETKLDWHPLESFSDGLRKTIEWFLKVQK